MNRAALKRLDRIDQYMTKHDLRFTYHELNNSRNVSTPTHRHRRGLYGKPPKSEVPSLVTSEHLAGMLQGVWLTMGEHLKFTFEQAMQVTCNNINLMMKLLYAQILENPTLAMRQIFASEYLLARARGEIVEVTPSHEIPVEHVRFIPMEKGMCTKDIPVQYQIIEVNSDWMEGYLDPLTKVIHRQSLGTDCETVQIVPIQIGKKYYVYNANKTGIRQVVNLPEILIFQPNATINFKIEPHVVRHLKMYNYSEFQSAITINKLLRTAGNLNQIYGQHGFRHRNYNDTITINGSMPGGQNPISSWWSSSPFAGYVKSITDHAYQVWVFMVALYVTFGWAASCCFPEGFGAKLNMRNLATHAKEKYEARKQRLERQKLDVADARASELIELANRTLFAPNDPQESDMIMSDSRMPSGGIERQIARVRFSYDRTRPSATFEKLAEIIHKLNDRIASPNNSSEDKVTLDQGMMAARRQVLAVTMDLINNPMTPKAEIPKMEIITNPLCSKKCEDLTEEIRRIASAPLAELVSEVRIGKLPENLPMYPKLPEGNNRQVAVIWNDTGGQIGPPLSLYVHVRVGTVGLIVLWDTGAQMSLIPHDLVEQLGLEYMIERSPITASGLGGEDLKIMGRVKLILSFTNFTVEPDIFKSKPEEAVMVPHYFEVVRNKHCKIALMGLDFAALFTEHKISMANETITFIWDKDTPTQKGYDVKLSAMKCPLVGEREPLKPKKVEKVRKLEIVAALYQTEKTYGELKIMEHFELAPRSVLYIPCTLKGLKSGKNDLMFTPSQTFEDEQNLVITRQYLTRAVIADQKLDKDEPLYVMAFNGNTQPVQLTKGTSLGFITSGKGPVPDEPSEGHLTVHRVVRSANTKVEKVPESISREEKEKCLKDLGFKHPVVDLTD